MFFTLLVIHIILPSKFIVKTSVNKDQWEFLLKQKEKWNGLKIQDFNRLLIDMFMNSTPELKRELRDVFRKIEKEKDRYKKWQ